MRFQDLLQQYHSEQRKAITTTCKGGYTVEVKRHIRCTATPIRRASQGNIKLEHYRLCNTDAYLQAGRTGKIQCSPYQFQFSSHDTIGTYYCDNEFQASAAQDIFIDNNETNNDQKKV